MTLRNFKQESRIKEEKKKRKAELPTPQLAMYVTEFWYYLIRLVDW